MCGITGTYGPEKQEATERMLAGILHRGPDGHGVYDAGYGSVGHSRLAILDPEHGRQPFVFGSSVIAFNGEIYNYRELAARHLTGTVFTGHSDTEVILHLFLKLGSAAVPLLDGMFAFAVMHDGKLFAARDPLGIKPLYYGEYEGAFVFASEVRALARVCSTISEFPPGHWYDTETGWHRYYDLEKSIVPFTGTETEAIAGIRTTVMRAVEKRLLADVTVGVSLSGGLDSSIVTVCARRHLDTLETFAVGMEGSGDLAAARMVAEAEGTRHHELVYTEKEMIAVLPSVVASVESFDPALVRSSIPNWFLADLTSKHVKVMLTGEGADELYAGYDYMARCTEGSELEKELLLTVKSLHNTNLQRADRLSMAFGVEARVPFLDRDSTAFALGLPPEWKLHANRVPKYLLRKAFEDLLPSAISSRPKLKFSHGAGSANIFAEIAERTVSESDFLTERNRMKRDWHYHLENKEALYYYRILHEQIADEIIFPVMGSSRSL